jgi:hypothetical protein
MTLGTFLRHVQPGDNTYLLQNLILPPDVAFDGIMYQCDDEQCLDRPPRRELHSVDITNENQVILSKPGTPFVDAYINLRLRNKTGERTDLPTTLFVHYEHSTMRRPPKLKVSAMNKVINELLTTLVAMQWDTDRLWLFLWVTNRPIGVNAKPHEKLLWVGQDNFEKHAPLIACRGLVRPGEQGQDESERYLTRWHECGLYAGGKGVGTIDGSSSSTEAREHKHRTTEAVTKEEETRLVRTTECVDCFHGNERTLTATTLSALSGTDFETQGLDMAAHYVPSR